MKRVENFKKARHYKRNIFLTFLLSAFIIVPGLLVSDYSINSIMKNKNSVELVSINYLKTNLYEFNFANYKVKIDLTYMISDLNKLKDNLKTLF